MKAVVGVATVLGGRPVVIESQGVRHELSVELIGTHVDTHHETEPSEWTTGTRVTLTVPSAVEEKELLDQAFHPVRLAQGFALANPHVQTDVILNPAFSMLSGEPGDINDLRLYPTITAEDRWRKYLPGDYGSPWWYDLEAFTDLVIRLSTSENPPPLGDFIGRFTGLSRSATRTEVRRRADLDNVRLSDLYGCRDRIPSLWAAMRTTAKAPTTASLGPLGKEHLRARLTDLGYGFEGSRHWYKRADMMANGVPWVVEVFVLGTAENTGGSYWLMNHSMLMADPTSKVWLSGGEVSGYGIGGLLSAGHLHDWANFDHVTVVHLICPAPTFTDRGKTTLVVPPGLSWELKQTVWAVTRKVFRDWEQARKDQRRQEQQAQVERDRAAGKPKRPTIRDTVFSHIRAAHEAGGGERLPISARTMFY